MMQPDTTGPWIVFAVLLTGAFLVDIFMHSHDKEVKLKEASLWSLFYVAVSMLFAVYLWLFVSTEFFSLFMTGYVLEKALSIDNLFVFTALFGVFSVPRQYRHRILFWGILGAIVFRAIFVLIGASLLEQFGSYVMVIFAFIIAYTAYVMLKNHDGDEDDDFTDKWYIKYPGKIISTTSQTKGSNFFIGTHATRFFMCLVAIELADIVFAFDSVPAVIAVTQEPVLIYSSIMFAIVGLRALYFVLDSLTKYLKYLETGVIIILFYIAVKIFCTAIGYHIDPVLSLLIVLGVLTVSVLMSLFHYFNNGGDKA